jgi:hypothetical protein
MRLPGRKTTVFIQPDVLERPRLGIVHAQPGFEQAQAVPPELEELAPVLGDPEAALPIEESRLRETALVETAPALSDAPAAPGETAREDAREYRRIYVPL